MARRPPGRLLQIARSEPGPAACSDQHPGPDLFAVVKGENEVGQPARWRMRWELFRRFSVQPMRRRTPRTLAAFVAGQRLTRPRTTRPGTRDAFRHAPAGQPTTDEPEGGPCRGLRLPRFCGQVNAFGFRSCRGFPCEYNQQGSAVDLWESRSLGAGSSQVLRRAPRSDQIDHLLPELRRIRRSRFRHREHLLLPTGSGVRKIGSTPDFRRDAARSNAAGIFCAGC